MDKISQTEIAALHQRNRRTLLALSHVNHGRIFWIHDKAGFPAFLQAFLLVIYNDGTTVVQHAGHVRGHFAVAKKRWPRMIRQRVSVHDGIGPLSPGVCSVQWFHEAFPKQFGCSPHGPLLLMTSQQLHSVRTHMPAVAPFRDIDMVTWMNLNLRIARGCSLGMQRVIPVRGLVVEHNCPDFGDLKNHQSGQIHRCREQS